MKITAEVLKELEMPYTRPDIYKYEIEEMQEYKKIIAELKDVLDKFSVIKSTFVVEAIFKEIVDKKL